VVELIKDKKEIDKIIQEEIRDKNLIFTTHYRIGAIERGIDDDYVRQILFQFDRVYAIEKETLKYGDIGYELFYKLSNNTDFSIATCPKKDKLIIIHAVAYKRSLRKRLGRK